MRIKYVRIEQASGRLYGDVYGDSEKPAEGKREYQFKVSLPLNRPDVATHLEALRRLLLLEAERRIDEMQAEMISEVESEEPSRPPRTQRQRRRPPRQHGQTGQLARPA